jgi:hypothetical protein
MGYEMMSESQQFPREKHVVTWEVGAQAQEDRGILV